MKCFMKQILLFLVTSQLIWCQYISRGANYFHNPYKSGIRYVPNRFNGIHNSNGYNVYRHFDNDYKNNVNNNNNNNINSEYENPVTVQYIYKPKPFDERWKEWKDVPIKPIPPLRPVHKPESFVEDYSEDEYTEPLPGDKHFGSFHSGVDYDKNDEEHHEKDYKEAAGKKFGALDKHSDSGHKEAEFAKVGGFHDKHLDAKQEAEHGKFKKDGEYSHDRGSGFIKAWSWDRKNIKGNIEGEKTKLGAEITAGEKGGFGAVAAKGSEGHDSKGLKAIAGAAGYGKSGHEESSRKSNTGGKSDFDKEFPIFG